MAVVYQLFSFVMSCRPARSLAIRTGKCIRPSVYSRACRTVRGGLPWPSCLQRGGGRTQAAVPSSWHSCEVLRHFDMVLWLFYDCRVSLVVFFMWLSRKFFLPEVWQSASNSVLLEQVISACTRYRRTCASNWNAHGGSQTPSYRVRHDE